MTLHTIMDTDVDTVFLNTDDHAKSVTYIPMSTNTPETIKAIFDPIEQFGVIAMEHGRFIPKQGKMYVDSSVVTNPQLGDQIILANGDCYRVEKGHQDEEGMTILDVVQVVRKSFEHKNTKSDHTKG